MITDSTSPPWAGTSRGNGTPLTAAQKLTWGHVSAVHVIAGIAAAAAIFTDAAVTSFSLTDPQTYTLGALAVASFLTALGGRYAQLVQEFRAAAAAIGAGEDTDAS